MVHAHYSMLNIYIKGLAYSDHSYQGVEASHFHKDKSCMLNLHFQPAMIQNEVKTCHSMYPS